MSLLLQSSENDIQTVRPEKEQMKPGTVKVQEMEGGGLTGLIWLLLIEGGVAGG